MKRQHYTDCAPKRCCASSLPCWSCPGARYRLKLRRLKKLNNDYFFMRTSSVFREYMLKDIVEYAHFRMVKHLLRICLKRGALDSDSYLDLLTQFTDHYREAGVKNIYYELGISSLRSFN